MKLYVATVAAAIAVSGVGCSTIQTGSATNQVVNQSTPRATIFQAAHFEQAQHRTDGLVGAAGWLRGCGSSNCGDACECGEACGECCGPYAGGGCGLFQRGGCPGNCNGGCLQQGISTLIDCPCGCRQDYYAPGPTTAQMGYPYYTVRGPRDFLMANPPSIGPR